MKLVTAPDSWSCGAAALAMVLDVDYSGIVSRIGHDGSEIINEDLRPPACHKGFHIQELIEVALENGYAVTPIECMPVQTATGEDEHDVKIKRYESIADRLEHHMFWNDGILMGQIPGGFWHAVAWDHSTIQVFDPRGKIYPYYDIKINLASFHRFDRIDCSF